MSIMSFDKFKKAMEADQLRTEQKPEPIMQRREEEPGRYERDMNNAGVLTFEQFKDAQASGTNFDDYLTQRLGTSSDASSLPSVTQTMPPVDNRTDLQKMADRVLGIDRSQVTGEKTNWGKLLGGTLAKGYTQWADNFWKTANFILDEPAQDVHDLGTTMVNGAIDLLNNIPGVDIKELDYTDNFIRRAYNTSKATTKQVQDAYQQNSNSSMAAQIVDNFGTSTVAALPFAIEAMITAPAQAARLGQATTAGLQYFSGLQNAQGIEAFSAMAKQGFSELMKNPQFWTSYLQVAGEGYENALEDGMEDADAALYGLVNGFFNAMIEVGGADEALGGIQNLPMRLQEQGGKMAVVDWVKDAVLGEGLEEVNQGITERALKGMSGRNVPIVSLDPGDQDAILNPWTAAQEFTGGAVVGAVLGGAQTGINAGITKTNRAIINREINRQEKAQNRQAVMGNIIERVAGQQDAEIGEADRAALAGIYDAKQNGTNGEAAASALVEAYRLGKEGKTTAEEARRESKSGAKLTAEQFERAFSLGQGAEDTEARTVDSSTEEGKTALTAALASLGTQAEAAAETYEEGQDVDTFAAAMSQAAGYAANGGDVKALAQAAKDGETGSRTLAALSDKQIEAAQQIGEQMRQTRETDTKAQIERRAEIQRQAEAILEQEIPELGEINAAIRDVTDFRAQEQQELASAQKEMAAMREADPEAEASEAYQNAQERAARLEEALENDGQILAQLKDARKEARGKAKRTAGKAIYESADGEVGGLRYKAADRSKFSQTQKATARIAEIIAKVTGLDIHIADFGQGVGGEYLRGKGGELYLNINASFNGANISIGSLCHELTHWMQEYAPEEYAELKRVVMDEISRDPKAYAEIFGERSATQSNLSPDEISDEMVANACQTVLMDEESVKRIVQKHRNLAEKLRDFILRTVDRLKAAFSEIDAAKGFPLYKEVKAAEQSLDRMREIWLNAFETASENLQAEKTVERAKQEQTAKAEENVAGEGDTQMQTWDNGEYADEYRTLTEGKSVDELYDAMQQRGAELRTVREQLRERKPEFDRLLDESVKNGSGTLPERVEAFNRWLTESGYEELDNRQKKLDREYRMLRDAYDKANDAKLEADEKAAIEKSGLSEGEYFGKQAVKEFGYTPYFYDAGYIMPNGKMLNFSGEKGKHYGSRGQDHRAIGTIFATTSQSEAMLRFMGYGNIRIMAESPGLDITSGTEPTQEQYRQMRAFIRSVSEEEYFNVDLTDERGNTIGNLEYEGTIRPDRIINDIKHFYQTGEVRDTGMSAFYQRWDDTNDDTAAEKAGREIAYARLQSENAILAQTVAEMKKLTGKQGKTIAALQKRLQITKTPETRNSDARKLAKTLITEANSKADVDSVAVKIKEIGDYLLQTETDKLSEETLKDMARGVAREIIESATEQVGIEEDIARQIAGDLRGRKLSIDEDFLGELDSAGGYESFRKRLFGRLTLAKRESKSTEGREGYSTVTQAYDDLQSTYGKAYFPDVANEGEQVQILAELIYASQPMEVNPYEQYMGEVVEDVANRIVMDAMNGVLRANPPTTADRQRARTKELQERIKELQAEDKLQQREAASLYNTIYDLSLALDKAESKYRTLRAESRHREAQVRAEGTARAAEAKAAERERATKKITALKEHYQEQKKEATARRNESAGVKKYRKQVEKKAKALYEMLMTNSDKKHVPQALKEPLGEFLESMDFSSQRLLSGGDETQRDVKFGARMQKLQQMIENQQRYLDGDSKADSDLGGYLDIGQDMMDYLREMSKKVTEAMNVGHVFTINQMNAEELKNLSNLLSNISTAIRNMNEFMANARYASVKEAASRDIERMEELGRIDPKAQNAVTKAIAWENGTPYYIFKRFGEGARSIFDGLTRGWEKLAFNAQEIIRFTEETYTDKEVKEWKNEIHDITLSDGSKIRMTTAQIMAFYALIGREQAMKHISKGGIRIGDIEAGRGKITDTKHYHLTDEDIKAVTGLLTARQTEVAQALQRFMARKGAEWGNEISMRRFGYRFYEEGDSYFPIKTDSNDRPMADTDAQENSMFRLLNLSSSKSLNPKASNALIVEDIFDTFANHTADMAKLNGLGLPILDAIKWFNYKERVDRGDGTYDTRTTQGAMEQAFGKIAMNYFRTLMKDINGVTEAGDRGTGLFAKLMSNYKAASVGANLRVFLLQPTSYVRASFLVKPKYLLQAFTNRNAYREAMENSGTAVWKSLGYYDTNISRGLRDQIEHNEGLRDKIVEASMSPAEFGDQRTWGRLWVACKMQTKAENPSLTGQTLIDKTNDLFRETIYATQVMDSTLTRSEIMRGKTVSSKAMTAFMAEPTVSFNIVMDAFSEFDLAKRRDGRQAAWQQTKGKLGKAFAVYLASASFSAVVESIADAIRDDDNDDFWTKFLQALFGDGVVARARGEQTSEGLLKSVLSGNLAQDMTLIGKLPYVKAMISTLQGYESKDMTQEAFSNLINVVKIWEETIKLNTGALDKATKTTYYGNMTTWGKLYKSMQALSQVSGIPGANAARDVFAVWNAAVGSIRPDWKIKTYRAKSERTYLEEVQPAGVSWKVYDKALDGDAAAIRTMVEAFGSADKLPDSVRTAIKSQVKDNYADGVSDEKEATDALTQIGMTANEAYFELRSIETGDDGKYTGLKRAAISGDAAAFRQEMSALTSHGVKEKDAQSQIKTFVRNVYFGNDLSEAEAEIMGGGTLTDAQARQILSKCAGLSVNDAIETVNGWKETKAFIQKHGAEYEQYDLNVTQAMYYYDRAAGKVTLSKYADQVDRYGLDMVKSYYGEKDGDSGWRDTGLTIEQYNSYRIGKAKCKGRDENGDGKTDSGSVKEEVLAMIDALPVSDEVKDALYLKNGWTEKKLNEAPWHN